MSEQRQPMRRPLRLRQVIEQLIDLDVELGAPTSVVVEIDGRPYHTIHDVRRETDENGASWVVVTTEET